MGIISKIKSKLSYKEVTPLYMDDLLRDAYQTTSVVGGILKGRIALVTGALAIGLVCFAYGINWLKYETSYDGFYPQSKQIYMLYGVDKQTGKKTEELPLILARRLKQDFPEVIETTQIYGNFASDFSYNEKRISNPDEVFIDENFFSFFPRKVICGRKDNILQSLSDIAITRSFAVKLFGTPEKALDKIISSAYEKKYQDCFRVGRYT